MPANQMMIDEALFYAERGWRVVPVKPRGKAPLTAHGVKDATCDVGTIVGWSKRWPDMNIGIACGQASGVVVIDVDGAEGDKALAELASSLGALPHTVTAATGNGRHLFFRCPDVPTGNRVRFGAGLDVRSDGGYVVAPPSRHENGKVYRWAESPCDTPLADLPEAWVCHIRSKPVEVVQTEQPEAARNLRPWESDAKPAASVPSTRPWESSGKTAAPRNIALVRQGNGAVAERARTYLSECAPAVQGAGGHKALLWAARCMVVGFDLDDGTALDLLWSDYNPRCVPPWDRSKPSDVSDFERKVKEARRTPGKPFGWLRDEHGAAGNDADTRLGAEIAADLLASVAGDGQAESDETEEDDEDAAWGRECESDLPDEMFCPPGFIRDFVRYTVDQAPYPHVALAFSAALSVLSLLAGRKYKTATGVRPNLYVSALAESGAGKEFPRKVIDRLAVEAGFSHMVGNRFASGEGLEDVLKESPSYLFKVDEVDTLLRPLGKGGDALTENMSAMLLSLYGESGGVHIPRAKAGQSSADRLPIESPNVVLFGTAIPKNFYGALEERVVTSGLLSRFLTIDVKRPRIGQDPVEADLPETLVETARRLATFWPVEDGKKHGDVATARNPVPVVVPLTSDASRLLKAFREECDGLSNKAVEAGEEVVNAVVVRSFEKAGKLALIYAVSEDHERPEIGVNAVKWAVRFVRFCFGRLLDMFNRFGATGEFEKDCRRVVRILENCRDRSCRHSKLLKKTRWASKQFGEVLRTLVERGTVKSEQQTTKGRPVTIYRLTKG